MTSAGQAVRPGYQSRYRQLDRGIQTFERDVAPLPGLSTNSEREVLINQLIDSERRNQHFRRILNRSVHLDSVDPHNLSFDPLKAAVHHWSLKNFDEAYWLVFQFVHFGKHPTAGWRFVREVYGRLNQGPIWSWNEISNNTPEFRMWLGQNQAFLLRKNERRGFGNHRKYSSLSHESERGTASVFESYADWVMGFGSHGLLFEHYAAKKSQTDAFEALYLAMNVVVDFGRIARFDYLMTLSRLEFLDIRPGHTYLRQATGPLEGARLLLGGPSSKGRAQDLEALLVEFSRIVGVTPDVIEDAICNWQKSPAVFKSFVL